MADEGPYGAGVPEQKVQYINPELAYKVKTWLRSEYGLFLTQEDELWQQDAEELLTLLDLTALWVKKDGHWVKLGNLTSEERLYISKMMTRPWE